MLSRALENAGYTAEDMDTVAQTVYWYADAINKRNKEAGFIP